MSRLTHCPCGARLDQPATGRPRRFCSEECRRKEHAALVRVPCAGPGCQRQVERGRRGRQPKYCSERCKKLAHYWIGRRQGQI